MATMAKRCDVPVDAGLIRPEETVAFFLVAAFLFHLLTMACLAATLAISAGTPTNNVPA